MKVIKMVLAVILLMVCSSIADAQSVVVYKKDGSKVEYKASEVKDVKYKPAYYYYAGWECPSNEEELKTKGTEIVNYESLTSGTVIRNYIESPIEYTSKSNYYVIIPTGVEIKNGLEYNVESSAFTVHTVSISGCKVYKSNSGSRQINAIKLVKK